MSESGWCYVLQCRCRNIILHQLFFCLHFSIHFISTVGSWLKVTSPAGLPFVILWFRDVQPIPFTRTLTSSPWYECASWHQHVGSKTLFKNHPLVNWQCQLTQVVLYNCCKMIAVVVPTMIQDIDYRNTKYILITLKIPQ